MILEPEQLLRDPLYSHEHLAIALMEKYYASIHHIAYSILHDIDAADEATQEAFIQALRKIDRYQVGTNLKAWLASIAVNQCRDKLRSRRRRQRWQDAWARLQSFRQPAHTPEKQTVKRDLNERLWKAVDSLGEKHSIPIILRYAHDLSVREIAEILHLPQGTVHSRLHYACKKLNTILGPLENYLEEIA